VNATTDRLTVADAMHHGLVTCAVDTPLSKVAQMMAGHRIHCVVVHSGEDQGAHFWCVVSDLDLAAAFARRELETTTAGSIAATPAITVSKREALRRAAQLMTEHEVTHLVVVDSRSLRPVGVISTLDIARVVAGA
jgi:CBS domain-containing protein